jgi:hypothetical protein
MAATGLGQLVHEMFVEGGITIYTPEAKTLVQPDGDVVVKVTPRFLADAALRDQHRRAVAERLRILDGARAWIKRLRLLFVAVGLAIGAHAIVGLVLAARHELLHLVRPAVELALSASVGLLGRFRHKLFTFVINRASRAFSRRAAKK